MSGEYGWQTLHRLEYGEDKTKSSLIVGLGWNLFSGGERVGSIREAQAARDEAQSELERRKLAVISEVRQAIASVVEAQEKMVIEKRTYELAGKTRDMVQAEYKQGKASLTRLNEAQRDFVRAEARYVQARIGLRQAWAGLRAASGVSLASFSGSGAE